jgi:hypothetical protein
MDGTVLQQDASYKVEALENAWDRCPQSWPDGIDHSQPCSGCPCTEAAPGGSSGGDLCCRERRRYGGGARDGPPGPGDPPRLPSMAGRTSRSCYLTSAVALASAHALQGSRVNTGRWPAGLEDRLIPDHHPDRNSILPLARATNGFRSNSRERQSGLGFF